ncbi:MAG: hypothetical protein II884_05470 [Synergistaceae bacterium]|nr:hypothetical protein [Synergistaceae bacterium]MBQ3694204.1 hypothetical protein [Synergistaceae bacterium]
MTRFMVSCQDSHSANAHAHSVRQIAFMAAFSKRTHSRRHDIMNELVRRTNKSYTINGGVNHE